MQEFPRSITKTQSETNPLVGGKLAVSDCSQVTDGAAVVVIASENYVKKHGLKKPVVKGYGHRVAPILFDAKMVESVESAYILPWTRQTCLDAYRRSGLTVDGIDVFETHDCFTSSEYAAIFAFGITEPGKEYEAVESGKIAFDGEKPINPSGGLIGCEHLGINENLPHKMCSRFLIYRAFHHVAKLFVSDYRHVLCSR